MASRRMKIKVMANIGRVNFGGAGPGGPSGSGPNRNPSGDSTTTSTLSSPTKDPGVKAGPNNLIDQSMSSSTSASAQPRSPVKKVPPGRDKTPEPPRSPRTRSKSPIKSPKVTSPRRSVSPTKPPPSSPGTRSRGKSPVIPKLTAISTDLHAYNSSREDEETSHVPSITGSDCTTTTPPQPTTPTRGPGIGPSVTPCRNSMVLHSVQKEIGGTSSSGSGANVSITNNETLRQRLQHSSLTTTKYAQLRKEFMSKYKHNQTPEKKDLTILHFTFWNPPKGTDDTEDFISEGQEPYNQSFGPGTSSPSRTESVDTDHNAAARAPEPEEKKSVGPRVKVGPDGEIIIDEQSLIVETTASQRAKKQLEDMETVVGMSGMYRHKKSKRGFDWSPRETVRFYRALTYCGTDFSMMKCYMFPKRTRAELKSKFKREDRKNSDLISQALSCQIFDPTYVPSDGESEDEQIEEIDLRDEEESQRQKIEFTKSCPSIEKYITSGKSQTEPGGTKPKRRISLSKPKSQESQRKPKIGRQKKLGQEGLPFTIDIQETTAEESIPIANPNSVDELVMEQAVIASKTLKSIKKGQIPPSPVVQRAQYKLPPKKDPRRRQTKAKSTESPAIPEVWSTSMPSMNIINPIKNSSSKNHRTRKNIIPKPKKCKKSDDTETPEVLKFDPTDILGLKIMESKAKTPERMIIDVPNDKEIAHQVFELQTTSPPKKMKTTHCNITTRSTTSATSKIKELGKAPPFRVPGPGLRHGETSTSAPPVFDDIEIEIS